MGRDERFRLTFLGAAQTVTGSMHLLQVGQTSLLVDCGMYQGRRKESLHRNRNLPRQASEADAVLLTHAHIDHSGNLPSLVNRGFEGPIHCTAATADLCDAMLRDSARIQESDAAWLNGKHEDDSDWEPVEPLYTEEDARRALSRFVPHAYDEEFSVLPGIQTRFIDAGHVLGSASAVVDVKMNGHRRRVAFSGDIGRRNLPILRDPQPPEHADYVVMESTYGNRTHAPAEGMQDQLLEVIERTRKRGGKVIIPSFALERAQEVIYSLKRLKKAGRLPKVKVYVDSPLTVKLTSVFRLHPECYDKEARELLVGGDSPFEFDDLEYVSSVEDSKAIDASEEPCVIIAASGMCEFGRVVHHLKASIEDRRSTVIIVGFQAQHTLGRRLVEQRHHVRIFGVERERSCEVVVLNGFSAHGDQHDLLDFATQAREHGKVRHVALVHGEKKAQDVLAQKLTALGFPDVRSPAQGDIIRF